jgi:CRP-like cAMP-binding protein
MPTRSPARNIPWAVIPLFQNLSAEERERLRPLALIRSFEPGERLFGEGDPAEQLHFILAGRFKIVKGAADGKEIILEILGPGDPIGVVAVLEGRPLPASATTLEAGSILTLPAEQFFALMAANPRLVRGLLVGLTRRLMELTRRLADRSSRADVRLARLFLTLSERMGRQVDERVRLVPVSLSRQEIADLVGITQETVIRIMSRWGKDGIVTTDRDGFRITDPERLRSLGGET